MEKHLRRIVITIFFMLHLFVIQAQQHKIDSLKQLLIKTDDFKYRIELIDMIAQGYTYINVDSAENFARLAYRLSREFNYPKGLAMTYDRIGLVKFAQAEFEEALLWLDSALVLQKELGDVERELAVINNLGMTYSQLRKDSIAMSMHLIGLKRAEKENFYNMAGSFTGNIGYIFLIGGQYDSARNYYERSAELFKKSKNIPNESLLTMNIGTTFHYQGEYAKALTFYKEALNLAKSIDFERVINLSNNNIALIYQEIESPAKAIEYSLPVLASYRKSGLKREEGELLHNMASLYFEDKAYDQAIEYGLMAVEIHESTSSFYLSTALWVVGEAYYEKGNQELAIQYLERGLKDAVSKENLKSQTAISLILIDELYDKGELDKALQKLRAVKPWVEKLASSEHLHDYYLMFAQVSFKKGDMRNAYTYMEKSKEYLDEVRDEKQFNALMRNAVEFETEKKEQDLERLKQESAIKDLEVKEKSFYLILTLICLALLLLGGFTFYLYAKNKRQQLLNATQVIEQKLLRVQLNPHFIFNALNSIQDFILKANTKSASIFLANFSRLMRQTLDNSRSDFIPLEEEIRLLEDYLKLQQLRKPFEFSITYQDSLDISNITIPPMFAQPFVENAVEHGLTDGVDKGHINIHFEIEEGTVVLTIKDNGVGVRTSTIANNSNHKSLATIITEERISILKENLKRKISFKIEELNRGTKVVLYLPFESH